MPPQAKILPGAWGLLEQLRLPHRRFFSLALLSCVALVPAARAESADSPGGSVPDPGLRDNLNGKDKSRSVPKSRLSSDPFLEMNDIKELKEVTLPLNAGVTDADAETLEYDINLYHLPAGKAVLTLKKKEKYKDALPVPVWEANLSTRSNRAMSLKTDVKDEVRSTFDAKGGFSRFFYMDRKEGDAKVTEKITFNYVGAMSAMYERPKTSADDKISWVSSTIQMTTKALDPLCAAYYLRAYTMKNSALRLADIPLSKNTPAIVLPVCTDRHVWNTNLFAVGKDHPDVGKLKNRECLIFEIDAPYRGLFERVGRPRIWVDIETGVIVKVTAETPFGPAEVLLSKFENSPLK